MTVSTEDQVDGVVRFHLRSLLVNGVPLPEGLLVPLMAEVGARYPALTRSGRQNITRFLDVLEALAIKGDNYNLLFEIVEHLRTSSGDVLAVGESALYPALQRILVRLAEFCAEQSGSR